MRVTSEGDEQQLHCVEPVGLDCLRSAGTVCFLDISIVALVSLAVEKGWMVIFYSKRSDLFAMMRKWSQIVGQYY